MTLTAILAISCHPEKFLINFPELLKTGNFTNIAKSRKATFSKLGEMILQSFPPLV
jgi:hypothetical protein